MPDTKEARCAMKLRAYIERYPYGLDQEDQDQLLLILLSDSNSIELPSFFEDWNVIKEAVFQNWLARGEGSIHRGCDKTERIRLRESLNNHLVETKGWADAEAKLHHEIYEGLAAQWSERRDFVPKQELEDALAEKLGILPDPKLHSAFNWDPIGAARMTLYMDIDTFAMCGPDENLFHILRGPYNDKDHPHPPRFFDARNYWRRRVERDGILGFVDQQHFTSEDGENPMSAFC